MGVYPVKVSEKLHKAGNIVCQVGQGHASLGANHAHAAEKELEHQHRVNWAATGIAFALLGLQVDFERGMEYLKVDQLGDEFQRISHFRKGAHGGSLLEKALALLIFAA